MLIPSKLWNSAPVFVHKATSGDSSMSSPIHCASGTIFLKKSTEAPVPQPRSSILSMPVIRPARCSAMENKDVCRLKSSGTCQSLASFFNMMISTPRSVSLKKVIALSLPVQTAPILSPIPLSFHNLFRWFSARCMIFSDLNQHYRSMPPKNPETLPVSI